MHPLPVLFGRFSERVMDQHMVGQIQNFSAAVRSGPAGYRAWRAQQTRQLDELARQVNEFAARFGGRPARAGNGLSLREKLANARGDAPKPAKPLPLKERLANASRGLPIDIRPKSPVCGPEKWATAYHEGAHAVAGRIHGLEIIRATVVTEGRACGSVTFNLDDATPYQRCVVALAGALGERQWANRDCPGPSASDRVIMDRALAEIADPRERQKVEQAAFSEASRIVRKHRGDIHAVAMKLLDYSELSGRDVADITRRIEQC